MSDNYIIEVRSNAAGIVVRDGSKYRFFAASHNFDSLEGQMFRSPKEAEQAAIRHLQSWKSRAGPSAPTIAARA